MYKDPDKQREANRQAKKRWKDKQVADAAVKAALGEHQADIAVREALGIPKEGIPEQGIPPVDEGITLPEKTDLGNTLTTTQTVSAVIPEQANIPADKRGQVRGKDIKVFQDLPADVQDTIVKMSTIDGKIDKDVHAKRTKAAIHYHHLFLDRCPQAGGWSIGVA